MSSIISFNIPSVSHCSVHNFADFIQDIQKYGGGETPVITDNTILPQYQIGLVNVTELVNITNVHVHW
jgi:hypothetical protein